MTFTGDPKLDEVAIEAGKAVVSEVFKGIWSATKKAPKWFLKNMSSTTHLGLRQKATLKRSSAATIQCELSAWQAPHQSEIFMFV